MKSIQAGGNQPFWRRLSYGSRGRRISAFAVAVSTQDERLFARQPFSGLSKRKGAAWNAPGSERGVLPAALAFNLAYLFDKSKYPTPFHWMANSG